MYELLEENIEHFMTCKTYGKYSWKIDWRLVYLSTLENQNTFGRFHVKGPRKKVKVEKWIFFFMKCER